MTAARTSDEIFRSICASGRIEKRGRTQAAAISRCPHAPRRDRSKAGMSSPASIDLGAASDAGLGYRRSRMSQMSLAAPASPMGDTAGTDQGGARFRGDVIDGGVSRERPIAYGRISPEGTEHLQECEKTVPARHASRAELQTSKISPPRSHSLRLKTADFCCRAVQKIFSNR